MVCLKMLYVKSVDMKNNRFYIMQLKDFTTPNTTFTKDSSIGSFLENFLGKEIVNNQIASAPLDHIVCWVAHFQFCTYSYLHFFSFTLLEYLIA